MAGQEVLFCSVINQLRSPEDALVTVIHWNLISNEFKCCGVGDDEKAKNQKKSEMLPKGWNDNQDMYTLQYKDSSDKVYILKIMRVDEDLLVHFMDIKSEKVTSINISTSDYTTGDLSSFDEAFKHLGKLTKQLKKDIIDEITKSPKSGSSSEPSSSRPQRSRLHDDDHDPLRVPPRHPHRQPVPGWTDPDDPFSVGRGDLDPFGRTGGGMVFDPFHPGGRRGRPDPSAGLPGRLPRGAVPPGARFDPFGPPGTGPGPDPDHLPPPGYDDMFM
ncbi:proteasome inhibitor PI31 subunit-like isoform X1 [Mytilus californianus]|uniref:proteasome inhibitor PI31 subunit-like isoform X1 n=2 Tax=Mytilus californianus TaxID=6549 RepID=UPI002247F375|nr:proteasome inhibitor PI31 subunit-like isoform X1 [Mytilus californianus]